MDLTLRRITTSGRFIPEIDGLRFIAIVSVVLFHVNAQWQRYFSIKIPSVLATFLGNGERGVSLFFVISGFVLALPFARHYLLGHPPVSMRRYFLRRLTRLEPPYVISLFVLALLLIISGRQALAQIVPHLLASIFYLHNLVYGEPSSISVVAWSLEVEVQFYLLAPALAFVFKIQNQTLRRLVLLGSIFLFAALSLYFPNLQLSIFGFLQFFLAGFFLADLYLVHSQSHRSKRIGWDLASVAGWPTIFFLPPAYFRTLGPLLIMLVFSAAFQSIFLNRAISNSVVTAIGGMCYSIYLLHYSLIAIATKIVGTHHPLGMSVLAAIEISLISCAFFIFIERPCMDPHWPAKLAGWFAGLGKSVNKVRPAQVQE